MYKREKDVNYEVLKGVSTDEIAQSLEEADYGPDKVLQWLLASAAVSLTSQQTDLHLLRAHSVIRSVLWAFMFTVRAYSPETP